MTATDKKLENSGHDGMEQPSLEKGALEQFQEPCQFSPQEERKLVRKVDLM